MGALLPVAAAAVAADRGSALVATAPVVWSVLGNQFEAGSMIAALCACLAVRFYVSAQEGRVHRWSLDLPVSALALMFTAGAVVSRRPEPLSALLLGTGIGVLGAGIIAIAKKYVDRWLGPLMEPDAAPAPAKPDPDTAAGIGNALRSLDVPPNPTTKD